VPPQPSDMNLARCRGAVNLLPAQYLALARAGQWHSEWSASPKELPLFVQSGHSRRCGQGTAPPQRSFQRCWWPCDPGPRSWSCHRRFTFPRALPNRPRPLADGSRRRRARPDPARRAARSCDAPDHGRCPAGAPRPAGIRDSRPCTSCGPCRARTTASHFFAGPDPSSRHRRRRSHRVVGRFPCPDQRTACWKDRSLVASAAL
jgi:hypothetical protein